MRDFKVAVIGCGGIDQVHGAVLKSLPNIKITACADIIKERAESFSANFGGKAYCSIEEVISLTKDLKYK